MGKKKRMNLTCSCGEYENYETNSDGDGHFSSNFDCPHFSAYVDCNNGWWTLSVTCKQCGNSGGFLWFKKYKHCGKILTRTETSIN